MAKLKDVLQYVAYGTALDVIEVDKWGKAAHLFSATDFTSRETIEKFYPQLLNRELYGGIHAEGPRRDRLLISLKPCKEELKREGDNKKNALSCGNF